jgi:hypothetical protein
MFSYYAYYGVVVLCGLGGWGVGAVVYEMRTTRVRLLVFAAFEFCLICLASTSLAFFGIEPIKPAVSIGSFLIVGGNLLCALGYVEAYTQRRDKKIIPK